MEISERREVVQPLADEGMTQQQIGDVLGVHHDTVRIDLKSGNPAKTNGQKPDIAGNAAKTEKQKALEAERDAERCRRDEAGRGAITNLS